MKIVLIRREIPLAGAVALLAAFVLMGMAPAPDAPVTFPHASLTIERADGKRFPLDIEVATSSEQKEYGLMFRRAMPRDSGMLFVFTPDQPASFWMKNTFISLDMLFVRGDGVIAKIVTHAEPFSVAVISSGEPVRGVIEINAGEADRRGLHTGDKVIYPAFTVR